jgi:hypothetical protein
VLASGNWYANDNTFELWNGETWTAFGEKTVPLNHPFMVSDGQGIVYVFGCRNNYSRLVPITVWRVNTNDQTAEVITETGLEAYEENTPSTMPTRQLPSFIKRYRRRSMNTTLHMSTATRVTS